MIIRWISEVPSKIVKILALWAVYAGQRPVNPLVSARIQHALFEINSGFGSARARLACGAQTRSSRRTRAARKLEDALGGVLSAARALQVHPRYICALTYSYTGSRHTCLRGRRRALTGRTRARWPGMPRTRRRPLSRRHGAAMGRTRHNAGMPRTSRYGTQHWQQIGSVVGGSDWAAASSLHESFGVQFYPVAVRV